MKNIMKNKMKKYLVFAIALFALVGCESYLDQREASENIEEDDVFGEYYNMRRFLEDGYAKIFHCDAAETMSTGKNHTHLSHFSDEASTNRDRIAPFKSGNWLNFFDVAYDKLGNSNGSGWVEFTGPYILGWQGIRIANRTIKEINTPDDITEEQKDQLLGQAYFIRSMCYFQIFERWGGMPYFTEPLDANNYLGETRLTAEETAAKIVEDCDLAFKYLPLEWDSDNTGRPVKSAALALKSRVLLYIASQTHNPSNDLSKWETAAKAADAYIKFVENVDPYFELKDASEAINAKVSSIDDEDYYASEPASIMEYRNIFLYNTRSPEVIFSVNRENVRASGGTTWKRYTTNLAYYVGKDYLGSTTFTTGLTPNENFVELFETKNGLAIEDDSQYNKQNPYINRDPRFYNSILYNGVSWPVGTTANNLEFYSVGENGEVGGERKVSTSAYPHTGYMMRKYWTPGATTSAAQGGPRYVELIIPFFRVAEAYLNYAEAAFEASGRSNINAKYSSDASAAAYDVLGAVNKVRNRVGMPDLNTTVYDTPEEQIARIRNERSIEFCYEAGHRWFDLMRWHELENHTKVYGVEIVYDADAATYPTNYKFEKYEIENLEKTFTDRNYLYPINPDEVNQYPEFEQNEGW